VAWLKTLVIGMGVLIVAGIGVVARAVLMVNGVGGEPSPLAPPVAGRIDLPQGARIAETHVDGKTVVLRLTMPDGSSRIALYETSGKLVSMIEVVEKK
jgi:hypothetical protein